jgi:hypothetical protein
MRTQEPGGLCSRTPRGEGLPDTAQPFRDGSAMLVIRTSALPSTMSRFAEAIRNPICSATEGRFDRYESGTATRLSISTERSGTLS